MKKGFTMQLQTFVSRRFLLATTSALAYWVFTPSAGAACLLVPTGGNDSYVCDSGTNGTLTDLSGNNTLTFPAAGTGQINGNVTFGAGTDRILMDSGTITGNVDQGDGRDSLEINAGQIVGNVQQGSGIDDFKMTGGTINALNQGDGLDTFSMSGGHIVDFFDDGDYGVMTGGRIGRVNMKLDDNYFNMSGGTIDRNLVTGLGRDTIIISGGTIGGNISTSSGVDNITVTGGSIGNGIKTGDGNDVFTWNGGGIIYNSIILEGDNDTARLSNLTNANLGGMTLLSGGNGADSLTFDNVKTDGLARFQGWEAVAATNDTELTFGSNLTLGDAATGTGSLSVDASSTLYGGGSNAAITAFTSGQLVNVTNAGRIDLTNGTPGATDSFTIAGNYVGNNGGLFLDTVLGDDTSASDKLVIDSGTASGTTGMTIVNLGGTGASTVQDGILVVQALNGANTGSGTFGLNSAVAAGAYEYYLFKGGVSAGTTENWYLRSALINVPTPPEPAPAPSPVEPTPVVEPIPPVVTPPAPPPAPAPPPESTPTEPPVLPGDPAPVAPPAPQPAPAPNSPPPAVPVPTTPAPVPSPTGLSTPPTSGATRVVADVVPLYRVEVPTYSVIAPAARESALATLGTFHERRGAQSIVDPRNNFSAAWARAFGQDTKQKWSGTVAPSIDGSIYGIQAGLDILRSDSDSGHRDIAGLFFGYASMDATTKGQAIGWNDLKTGHLDLDTTSVGAYWTHIGPSGWYLDGVLMGSWFSGDATSERGIGIDVDGTGITASLEGGYPVNLSDDWVLEPQAQLIWQHLSFDDEKDRFSSISFDTDNGFTGRLGVRLQGKYALSTGLLQPYLKANIWHTFSGSDSVLFASDAIGTDHDATSLELGGGVVYDFSKSLSTFATADYTFDINGEKRRTIDGNLGLRVKW
ncbi:autotransporter outer membrane beta-barrel domain-containing protein [Phyllobacterium myrsinacearum]|uniref:Outer membrane autotransporter protein n=1 Tax=Phyllobacterium myrsinacearum TaxID=28101 RepID=A0A839EQQ6_9HYPH|nr:autotransporter outer membrane beta-barrel domain-containing protein [Phyllobacterium myrsinacearum]MBA8878950.1 outer membrane autotransporter protein [Phyllobacterium myrsinacearum]